MPGGVFSLGQMFRDYVLLLVLTVGAMLWLAGMARYRALKRRRSARQDVLGTSLALRDPLPPSCQKAQSLEQWPTGGDDLETTAEFAGVLAREEFGYFGSRFLINFMESGAYPGSSSKHKTTHYNVSWIKMAFAYQIKRRRRTDASPGMSNETPSLRSAGGVHKLLHGGGVAHGTPGRIGNSLNAQQRLYLPGPRGTKSKPD